MRGLCFLLPAALLASCAGSGKTERRPTDARSLPGLRRGLYAVLSTRRGDITVRLLREDAPKTVDNFMELARGSKPWTDPASGQPVTRPLYDGTLFFRVIPGFMIQGGDPSGSGSGGPGFQVPDEIRPGLGFDRSGMVGLASEAPNAGGSQFFITLMPAPWLNGKHTVFGEVVEGLDVARAISAAPRLVYDPDSGRTVDRPLEPQVLEQVRIEER